MKRGVELGRKLVKNGREVWASLIASMQSPEFYLTVPSQGINCQVLAQFIKYCLEWRCHHDTFKLKPLTIQTLLSSSFIILNVPI